MKYILRFSLLAFFCLQLSYAASAQIKLPDFISDNMVLQQQSQDAIWGWASPGEGISVEGSWNHVVKKTTANADGEWMLKIKTPKAGGPYTLTIKSTQTIVLHNVMIGEVWLCSGQSNMEMPVQGWPGAKILNSAQEIKDANYPDIRLFTVKRDIAFAPQKNVSGSWSTCSPQSVAPFSATAYFFGRSLYKKLKVPIGLIETCWGGTVAEAWTSSPALRKLGGFDQKLNTIDSLRPHLSEMAAKEKRQQKTWNKESQKINTQYSKTNFNDPDWKNMQLPVYWEKAGHPNLDGIVWFRKVVKVPAAWAGKALKLDPGPIDDNDITWFNGHKVGATEGWQTKRLYNIPAGLVKAGNNTIAIRVTDTKGNGGIYGKKNGMKLYPAGNAGQSISIAGDWKYKIAVVKHASAMITQNPNNPSVLYNGMIAPLIPYGIKGAIWYQGESNVGRAAQYAKLFPDMIKDWRHRWDARFPFYFVQIAPYPYGGDGMKGAALRDAQRTTLQLPNTGMAVTLDIGDTTNIHPSHKQAAGKRLALWALAKTYKKKGIVCSGPLYKSMKTKGNKAIVSFDYSDGGLMAKGGPLNSFEIAGANGKFVPAKAEIEGNKIVLSASGITHSKAVRYGWRDTSVPHLFNKAGLPASSFSTEKLH